MAAVAVKAALVEMEALRLESVELVAMELILIRHGIQQQAPESADTLRAVAADHQAIRQLKARRGLAAVQLARTAQRQLTPQLIQVRDLVASALRH
jgi:hypothetical protein